MTEPRTHGINFVYIAAEWQEEFQPKTFNSLGFNLHACRTQPRNSVAVFVHGWGGGGYKTWMAFPQMVFDGSYSQPMDVALFDYDSGLRTAITRGSKLDRDCDRLSQGLAELEKKYSAVYLVCHSLGGLVAGQAVKSMLTRQRLDGGPTQSGIAGIFLFASPRGGTSLANPMLGVLVNEFRWLKPFSAKCESVEQFFTDHVQSNTVASSLSQQFLIPRYAYLGSADKVVKPFSASFGVPKSQIFTTRGNHRNIAKPTRDDHPQIAWLNQNIHVIEGLREQQRRELEHSKAEQSRSEDEEVIVTSLWHDPSSGSCVDVYNDVRAEAIRSGILVQDRAELGTSERQIDLLVTVHDAASVGRQDEHTRRRVSKALSLQEGDGHLTVAIAPIGDDCQRATQVISEWLLPEPPPERCFVEGAIDNEALGEVMWRWVQRIVNRDPRRPRMRRSSVESFADSGGLMSQHFGRIDET